jgi:hypothetical protein
MARQQIIEPMALSAHELQAVHAAAELLQPCQRARFVNNVGALYSTLGNLPDAIRFALASYGVAAGKRVFSEGRAR